MRWCPSGVQDSPTSTTTSVSQCKYAAILCHVSVQDEGFLQRLGLLAVACSDGQARILRYFFSEI